MSAQAVNERRAVQLEVDGVTLDGELAVPENPSGLVLFVHGSGSSRLSPRNRQVARFLQEGDLGTLLFDLFTPEEESVDRMTGELRFDIGFLTRRVLAATDWVRAQPDIRDLEMGYFGASTGAAAALSAAAHAGGVGAVVSRGGRPDLASDALPRVKAPTLLIVGGNDLAVLQLNREALSHLAGPKQLVVVPGATHLFEEPGALEQVATLARDWFVRWAGTPSRPERGE